MTVKEDKTQTDALEDNLSLEFHVWKHENIITKIIFRHIRDEIDNATQDLQRNAMLIGLSSEQKLAQYHILSAKIQYYTELININYEDVKNLRGYK